MDGSGVPNEIRFTYVALLAQRQSLESATIAVRDYLDTTMVFNDQARKILDFFREYGKCTF